MRELHLTKKDFKLEWYSGSGAGGQHRNKHQNCCRIIHLETGLKAQGTESRERTTNQETAFKRLVSLILSYYSAPEELRREWNTPIRNYHGVRNEVYDKASGLKSTYKDVVINNNITPMVEARHKVMANA